MSSVTTLMRGMQMESVQRRQVDVGQGGGYIS